MQQGRTENQVAPRGESKSRLHIRTPAGITSVRGTQLRVSVPAREPVSHTEVLEGAANVANAGQEVLVQAGYGTMVR
ncbi:FecR domain-containing protein, partial [Salmonella enterica]|uniref:FecR domain-containing protein n=1 Tax=Salmonella enterica TaxID=28901 RepID=UPI003D2E4478